MHFCIVGYIIPIKRLSKEDNLGGILQLKICRKSDIIFIPEPKGRIIYGTISLKPGAAFISWDVTLESARLQSRENVTREGSSKSNTLPFTIPKDRIDIRDMLTVMEADEFVVTYLENGRQKLFGLLHAPVRFSFGHDSGEKFGDLNAYSCRFFYEGPDNVYFYDGTTGTPPAGAQPAIVRLNGEVIGSLSPGETLNIVSPYTIDYFSFS